MMYFALGTELLLLLVFDVGISFCWTQR